MTSHMEFKTAITNYTFHNPTNKFCNELSVELLDCSNTNDTSIYVPELEGQNGMSNSCNSKDNCAEVGKSQVQSRHRCRCRQD